MTSDRLPEEQFAALREWMEGGDEQRERIIKTSRDLQRDAKHAIYLAHQGELENARGLVDELSRRHAEVMDAFDAPRSVGAYSACLEEYAEAAIFVAFREGKAVPTYVELALEPEEYLGGLSDATGELGRRAVIAATAGDTDEVQEIRDFIDAVQGEMVKLHLRNSSLRKKYDAVKYNLKKVEELLYELRRKA